MSPAPLGEWTPVSRPKATQVEGAEVALMGGAQALAPHLRKPGAPPRWPLPLCLSRSAPSELEPLAEVKQISTSL